jgi:hypothetical protein
MAGESTSEESVKDLGQFVSRDASAVVGQLELPGCEVFAERRDRRRRGARHRQGLHQHLPDENEALMNPCSVNPRTIDLPKTGSSSTTKIFMAWTPGRVDRLQHHKESVANSNSSTSIR